MLKCTGIKRRICVYLTCAIWSLGMETAEGERKMGSRVPNWQIDADADSDDRHDECA